MVVRNLSYYVPVWSILAAGWVGMFVVTPFRKQADQAIFAAYGFGKSTWQVGAPPPFPHFGVYRKHSRMDDVPVDSGKRRTER